MAMLCHTEYAIRKKEQIEEGVLKLMEGRQYQDISVTDICQGAGIPRRTFYHYFENKEAVLDSVIETMMRQCFLKGVFDFSRGPEHIKNNFLEVFRFWDAENRRKLDALMRSNLDSRLMAWSSKWIQDEQIGVFLQSELDPKLARIVLMIGTTDFFALLFHWSRGGYQETPEEMAEYAVWVLPQALYNKTESAF